VEFCHPLFTLSLLTEVPRLLLNAMAERRCITRSYGVLAIVFLLVAAIGLTTLHWHNDWADQGCQLCHLRNLPVALGSIAQGPGSPALEERDWLPDNRFSELEAFGLEFSCRAPPQSITFTL
jgi:hypothetical protein